LDYNIDGDKTTAASIYMDPTNSLGRDNHNTLLHGHNMKNGSMFNNVVKYKDERYFNSHRIIQFDTLYDNMTWEVFSVYVLDADFEKMYTSFGAGDSFHNIANGYLERSIFSTNGLVLTERDRFLTLSTCSYETPNSRTILHARLIYLNGAKVAEPVTGYIPQ